MVTQHVQQVSTSSTATTKKETGSDEKSNMMPLFVHQFATFFECIEYWLKQHVLHVQQISYETNIDYTTELNMR